MKNRFFSFDPQLLQWFCSSWGQTAAQKVCWYWTIDCPAMPDVHGALKLGIANKFCSQRMTHKNLQFKRILWSPICRKRQVDGKQVFGPLKLFPNHAYPWPFSNLPAYIEAHVITLNLMTLPFHFQSVAIFIAYSFHLFVVDFTSVVQFHPNFFTPFVWPRLSQQEWTLIVFPLLQSGGFAL